jgi:ABC-type multidrug transport system ATPase subunit
MLRMITSGQHEVGMVCLKGLCFGYPSQLIFKDFSWETSEPVTILEGPSGCGKTTFLRILAGHLIPSSLEESQVPGPARLVLQDDGLFPWLTSEGNLALASDWQGFEMLEGRVRAIGDVVAVYRRQIVGTLSFGQRRLIELLRVLACPTPLTLLDEPLNFLDATRRKLVIDTIGELAERGCRFIISSHYETDFRHLQLQRYSFAGDMPYDHLANTDTK